MWLAFFIMNLRSYWNIYWYNTSWLSYFTSFWFFQSHVLFAFTCTSQLTITFLSIKSNNLKTFIFSSYPINIYILLLSSTLVLLWSSIYAEATLVSNLKCDTIGLWPLQASCGVWFTNQFCTYTTHWTASAQNSFDMFLLFNIDRAISSNVQFFLSATPFCWGDYDVSRIFW